MQRAVDLSAKALTNDRGGPFGAIVVKDNEIVGSGYNQVISTNDPTAHAEILAIRDACRYLGTFDLTDCEIYCSCEPCPMCLGAIYWSRISRIYYSNTRRDAAAIGFEDDFYFGELAKLPDQRSIPSIRILQPTSLKVFEDWGKKVPRVNY
ncbi:MAG TPA: nucleoside deaminase [Chitinophagaceae bacterium]|nr:nucleoside deaminase [Chitinophagaceae bacterium]